MPVYVSACTCVAATSWLGEAWVQCFESVIVVNVACIGGVAEAGAQALASVYLVMGAVQNERTLRLVSDKACR